MDSALLSLLGALLLSIIGLFAFIWSMRQGLLVENPKAASVIFADGEVGRVDDPAAAARAHNALRSRGRDSHDVDGRRTSVQARGGGRDHRIAQKQPQ